MTEATSPALPRTPLQQAMDRIAHVTIAIAAAALLGLVLVQGWQVIARYVLNDSPSWTEPLTLVLLSTTMAMGAAAAVHERRHFAFALLAEALPASINRVLQAVAQLIIMLIGAAATWWGGMLFVDGLHIPAAGADLPQGASYLPLAIGGALMMLFALHQFIATTRDKGTR